MNKQPNILFILSDQHTVSAMSDVADNPVSTPNLDSLCQSGVRFDNAYCQNPLCVPSRSSLVTGQYSRNNGIYDNQHILSSDGHTLARQFSQAGYRTALIGKSHFNGEQFHGYQERPYGDFLGQAHQPDPARTPDKGESGLGDILDDSGPSGIPLSLMQTEICVAESCKWLQSWVSLTSACPFFLSVHFDKPHFPINPPRRYHDALAGKVELPEFPSNWLDKASPFVNAAAALCSTSEHRQNPEVNLRALTAYLVGLIDMFPTLCRSAGVPVPDGIDGIDLGPALLGEVHSPRELVCETTILKHPEHAGCMLRREQWKYCYYLDGQAELYDLDNDPDEWNNLAIGNEYDNLCSEIRERVVEFHQPDQFASRYARTPRMPREKHFYPYSNQFLAGNGTIFDARP